MDRTDEVLEMWEDEHPDGDHLLDDVVAWFGRFIRVTDPDDLPLLALWAVHTHLAPELYSTPRLQLDSTVPGSGKTTVLDHMCRLCFNPVQAALITSSALIPRMLERGPATILMDEVDRNLAPNNPGTPELLAVLNSGYRVGASKPTLVPDGDGGWEMREFPTFAPVAMAGNAPQLPEDTRSRSIRVLLMPDLDGTVEDSDWEVISDEAKRLHDRIVCWADSVRDSVKGLVVDLPAGCISRSKDKWRPMKRVAVVAGGAWPALVDKLIEKSLAEDAAEKEAGLRTLPPGMVLLNDLKAVWPKDEAFVPTKELVRLLVNHNPSYWSGLSAYGKELTETRLGRMVNQAAKITSSRPGGSGPRGFLLVNMEQVWLRLKIGTPHMTGEPGEPGGPGWKPGLNWENTGHHRVNQVGFEDDQPGEPGCNPLTWGNDDDSRVNRVNRVHRSPGGVSVRDPFDYCPPDDDEWGEPFAS
jgi:hypothetical protein